MEEIDCEGGYDTAGNFRSHCAASVAGHHTGDAVALVTGLLADDEDAIEAYLNAIWDGALAVAVLGVFVVGLLTAFTCRPTLRERFKPLCHERKVCRSPHRIKLVTVVMVAVVGVSFTALVISALSSRSMTDVNTSMQALPSLTNEAVASIEKSSIALDAVNRSLNELIAASPKGTRSSNYTSASDSLVNTMIPMLDDAVVEIAVFCEWLHEFCLDMAADTERVTDYAYQILVVNTVVWSVGTFIACCRLVAIVRGGLPLPPKGGFAVGSQLCLLLLFLLSSAMMLVSISVADVCVTPDSLIYAVEPDPFLTWYTTCNERVPSLQESQNPMFNETTSINMAVTIGNEDRATLDRENESRSGVLLGRTKYGIALDEFKTALGYFASSITDGVMPLITCESVNGVYTNFLDQLCGDTAENLIMLAQLGSAAAFMLAALELIVIVAADKDLTIVLTNQQLEAGFTQTAL